MREQPRFAVVGCSGCQGLWILEDRHEHETTTCPQCGATHATTQLRALAQHDEHEVICELRSRIVAQQAGYDDAYEREDDYAMLAERADEYLDRYDELFGADVEDTIERTRRIQQELFSHDAEAYLTREEPLAAEALDYLARREEELERLIIEHGPTSDDGPETNLTPFSDRSEVSIPPESGITLTTPETLPEATDTRLADPPIAPTDLWKRLWQTGPLTTQLSTALHTLADDSYQSAWERLVEAGGMTAPASAEAPAYAEYVLDGLKRPIDEDWYDIVRLTRQLGGATPIGNTERADIINGPVALFAACDVVPAITIRLSHAFFEDYQRNQRETFLQFLTDLSMGFDIRIVCSGQILPKKLVTHHADELPTVCVTTAPDPYQIDTSCPAGSPEEIANRALAELGYGHAYYEVLDVLAGAPSNRRQFAALRQNSVFDISANGVQKRVDRLRELELVSVDQLNADAFVQLLPAGEWLLDLQAKEQQAQACLDEYETVPDAASSAPDPSNSDVSNPPKFPHKSVCSAQAREKGGGSASFADGTATATAVDDDTPGSRCYWLPPAHQHAVVASCTGEHGGPDIALADEAAPAREQPRDCLVGYDADRNEVVVSLQPSPVAAYTMTRVCTGLLGPLLRNTLLTAADLDKDGEPLGKLLEAGVSTTVLRNIHQLGCLPERSANGADYREELTAEFVGIIEDVPQIQTEDGFDSSLARSVCQRAHGLAGTAMRIYELLGWSVTQEWTFPDRYSVRRPDRRRIYMKTLAKHIAIVSRYGGYPAHRILYESDGDVRADSLGCPNVDDVDPTGECFGKWVLRGPGIDRWASDLTDLEAAGDLELQEGERNFTPFLVELSIGQATRKSTIDEAATRLCAMKDLSLTRSASALLAAFTDSVFSTAEALSGLATARDFERDISLDEVRFALSTLAPEALLPQLDTDGDDAGRRTARSKIVHTLLTATEPLSTGVLAERAGVSKQSIRNHRDDLEALGLLAIDDLGQGKPTYYRLTLPFRDERGDRDAPRPLFLPDGEGAESMYSVRGVVHDLLEARGLLDEAYADTEIADGLVGWPPSLEPAIGRWPWLRPWIDTIYWLFGQEGGGTIDGPTKWIDGPFQLTSRFGTEPVTTQAQLPVWDASPSAG